MRPWLPTALSIALAGCGYPGEPLPPALNRPVRVTDLAVVERGAKLDVHFTVPTITTEGLKMKSAPEIELRIGPAPMPGAFVAKEWERTAERIAESEIGISKGIAHVEIPAAKFYGKTEIAAVRVHGPQGRDLGWSNFETLTVAPALPVPEGLEAANAPDAIRLEWHAAAPEFRVYRKQPEDAEWSLLGTSPKPVWVDATIVYGKTYEYFVQSVEKSGERYIESEASPSISFKPVDTFPPAVPTGLTAVPGTRTIELVWDRNVEKDFSAYRVYRDGVKIEDALAAPAYADRNVKIGTKYRYQIGAVDNAGNESALSAAVEAAIP